MLRTPAVSDVISMSEYPAMFRGYIVKSIDYSLAQIDNTPHLLPDDVREQALHNLSFALKWADAWPTARDLLIQMAPKMEQAGFRDEWIPYLEEGLTQARFHEDQPAAAELYLQLGVLYQLRSKYDMARTHLEASIQVSEALEDAFNQARAINRLAYLARLERKFDEAESLIENSHNHLNDTNLSENAYGYYVLGLVALDKRNWEEAISFSEKALNLWEKQGNPRLMGRSLLCLSVALEKLERYSEAANKCKKADHLFGEAQDTIYQASVKINLGNVYLALKQPKEALNLYLMAKPILRKIQDKFSLIHVDHNIGMAYRQLKQWDKAEEAYLSAIRQEQKIGNIAWVINTMDELGLLYQDKEEKHRAITAFKDAIQLLPQIENDVNIYEHFRNMLIEHLRAIE
ncbi:MAG: tetratricopeptide repeat protein [Chloroflexota bacterium]